MKEEISNLIRLRRTHKAEKAVTFYAGRKDFYAYFEGLIKELTSRGDMPVCYITSDSYDPVLQDGNSGVTGYYLNKFLPLFMAFVDCRVFIMTMPDLNSFHIKRSIHPVRYVYTFHSPISTHMIYRREAFDHYDSILCVGPHQVEEIRKREKIYGLKPKRLVETGCSRTEKIYEAYKEHRVCDERTNVLVAPTWGTPNLYDICGTELIEILLRGGYKVTLGFHPETVKKNRHFEYDGVATKTSVLDAATIAEADVLITDWSGISLEYAFGTERPVIFIDTPPKIRNPRYRELGIEPVEISLRNRTGTIVLTEDIKDIPFVIQDSLSNSALWKDKLSKLRSEYMFNFGRASKIGANYIRSLL